MKGFPFLAFVSFFLISSQTFQSDRAPIRNLPGDVLSMIMGMVGEKNCREVSKDFDKCYVDAVKQRIKRIHPKILSLPSLQDPKNIIAFDKEIGSYIYEIASRHGQRPVPDEPSQMIHDLLVEYVIGRFNDDLTASSKFLIRTYEYALKVGIDIFENDVAGYIWTLDVACEDGRIRAARTMLNRLGRGYEFDGVSATEHCLVHAILFKQIPMVEMLLNEFVDEIDINGTIDGESLLMTAVNGGDLAIVNLLLSVPGIDVNMIDDSEVTPLISAIINYSTDIVLRLLAEPEILVDAVDRVGETAFMVALECRYIEPLMLILEAKGWNIIQTLMYTLKKGDIDAWNFLLENAQFDVNERMETDMTLLHHAAMAHNSDFLISLLLDTRIDLNAVDDLGNTALHLAVMHDHGKSVSVLIEYEREGLDVNLKNMLGLTAFHEAKSLKFS